MLAYFWAHYLYEPLLNILIFIYGNLARENLGVAIILLTVALRIVLLPFSILANRSKVLYAQLDKKIIAIKHDFKNDPVLQKEQIRSLLSANKVNPWAKSITIGIQALVLVLLYQVFLGGINKSFTNLYRWVYHPDFINVKFLGFDLGQRSLVWALIVAVVLFIEIAISQKRRKQILMESEVIYRYFFPVLIFVVLYFLPMAKSLFVLTSLVFSFMVGGIMALVGKFKAPEEEDDDE